jgi:hypothetical protein
MNGEQGCLMGEPYSDRVGDNFIFGGNDGRIAGEAKIGGRRLTTEYGGTRLWAAGAF